MAMTPEALVKKRIRKILDDNKAYYTQPVTGGFGASGAPDFLVCHRGVFIGVEAKAGKGKTTALQDANLARIRAAGGIAIVVNENNLHELQDVLGTCPF